MNVFFSWINSGTPEQKKKKQLTAYALAAVAVLLVLSILTLAIMGIVSAIKNGVQNNELDDESVDPTRGYVTTTFAENQLHSGNLLMIDEAHPYVAEANTGVETIVLENGRAKIEDAAFYSSETLYDQVQKDALDAMNKMLVDFYNKTQDDNLYVNKSGTLNTFELKYTTGVSGSARLSIAGVEIYNWIFENAYKYGFVQLYSAPEANTAEGAEAAQDKTNIFRYVGEVHSNIMKDKKCETLSEYLELLKAKTTFKTHFRTTVNKVSYEVYYLAQGGELLVPEKYKDSYTVSGNNMDGYIVTVCKTTSK